MNNFSHTDNEIPRLTPRNEGFSHPEKLKRSEMDGLDASLWEELCIATSENEQANQHDFNALLKVDEFRQEVDKYKTLKLTKNESIAYPDKKSIKKNSPKIGLWFGLAAAVAAILIAIPTIITNRSLPDIGAHPLAITPYIPEKINKEAQLATHTTGNGVKHNNKVITQPLDTENQTKTVAANRHNKIENSTESSITSLEGKRPKLALETVKPNRQEFLLVSNTKEEIIIAPIQPINSDVIILALIDDEEYAEVETPHLFDRLREKSIIGVNKLFGQGTMVVKEYNSDGKLTLYAVQSNALNFEKKYTE